MFAEIIGSFAHVSERDDLSQIAFLTHDSTYRVTLATAEPVP
jgi:hypothetical protein